jgi:hypothetical protein
MARCLAASMESVRDDYAAAVLFVGVDVTAYRRGCLVSTNFTHSKEHAPAR